MKTKSLLIAAATLAAGIISSQAAVYSQNIVGYVNQSLIAGYNLVSVQFAVGNSNGASEIFPNVPDGTEFLFWDKTHSQFVYNYYDTGGGATAPQNSWYMSDYTTLTNQPVIAPGTALFVLSSAAVTNTIVGSVVFSSTNNLIGGYNMVGSVLPIGGSATNSTINMTGFPDGTETLIWDTVHSQYIINYYDTGAGASAPASSWYMSDYTTSTNPPAITVGQGFFVLPPSAYAWSQNLTNN